MLLLASLLTTDAFACDDELALMAGQHTEVGAVTVEQDGDDITVTYAIDNDASWRIVETHLYVDDVKPKKHAPGKFPYGDEDLDTTSVSYTIDAGSLDETLYLAAHAVVEEVEYIEWTVDEVASTLPETVTFSADHAVGDSYWEITVNGTSDLAGVYDGWCIDYDRTLGGGTYTAEVVYSLDDLSGLVEYPENFPYVNWIINQGYVGTASPGGYGTYTLGDVQKAIWLLIEDSSGSNGLGSWSWDRVNEILDDADASGEDFTPGCMDQVAVVLVPVDSSGTINRQVIIGQVTFIDIELECDYTVVGEETAWAEGDIDFKQSWASYWTCDQV
jgi:hypothetical protein